jgi:peptidoglycan hydrolase-like protein with peptidoglycan-binding domain
MVLTRNLRYGSEGDDVYTIKQRLFELGWYDADITTVVKHTFGADTRRAVRRFQAANGLSVDGIVGPITFGALFAEESAAEVPEGDVQSPEGRDGIPSNIGDEAACVIRSALAGETETRCGIVLDALGFAYDPDVPADYPHSLYIRGGNLYNTDLTPNVITLSRIASGAKRQPEYYDGGRKEMMERAVAANPSITGADCSGGVVGLLRHAQVVASGFDRSANGFAGSSDVRSVSKAELRCADFVHKNGHIGLYAGGGYAVEWMGGAYGCQLTRLDDRRGWNFVKGCLSKFGAWTAFLHRPITKKEVNTMQEWDVVGVIAALAALFGAMIAPIVRLTRAITRLTATMESMEKSVEDLTANNRSAHERLWRHEQAQDEKLCDHETRLRVIEEDR